MAVPNVLLISKPVEAYVWHKRSACITHTSAKFDSTSFIACAPAMLSTELPQRNVMIQVGARLRVEYIHAKPNSDVKIIPWPKI
mgnify:CR=1 FL=1